MVINTVVLIWIMTAINSEPMWVDILLVVNLAMELITLVLRTYRRKRMKQMIDEIENIEVELDDGK